MLALTTAILPARADGSQRPASTLTSTTDEPRLVVVDLGEQLLDARVALIAVEAHRVCVPRP